MKRRSGGKRRRRKQASDHFELAYRQTYLYEFVEEPSLEEGIPLPKELVQQLSDIEIRISRLEGERVFTSGEIPKALDFYIEEHPEMLSINAEFKALIESGRIRIA
jgi:hypothetical protein